MSDHPSSAELKAFMRGELTAQRTRVVIGHLLKRCDRCRAEMAPLTGALFTCAGTGAEPNPDAKLEAAYDTALDRAFETALRVAREESVPVGLDEQFARPAGHDFVPVAGGLDLCESLLERSRAMRHDDPARMIELAQQALALAEGLSPAQCGPTQAADVCARACAELANAFRVANNLREADAHMKRAFELRSEGSGDDLLAARLFDLKASLRSDQLRTAEAIHLLDAIYAIYLRHGDRHNAGRALISKATLTSRAGDLETANQLLAEGRDMIDAERDPHLALVVVHNLASNLVELSRFRDARELLRQNLWRYRQVGGWLDRLKLLGLGGRIDACLGNLERAERELAESKHGFDEAGLPYWSALIALDLAKVRLQFGRTAEARDTAEEAVRLFISIGVGAEERAALRELQDAIEIGTGAAVLESVAAFMRRRQHDPTARLGLVQPAS